MKHTPYFAVKDVFASIMVDSADNRPSKRIMNCGGRLSEYAADYMLLTSKSG
jgi:hypothetical protein